MAEISNYFPGDLSAALDESMQWLLSRMNADVSPFKGSVVPTASNPALAQGAVDCAEGTYAALAQEPIAGIVIDPIAGILPDDVPGPDGFPINYSPAALLSGY